jgi:hypothetical protein
MIRVDRSRCLPDASNLIVENESGSTCDKMSQHFQRQFRCDIFVRVLVLVRKHDPDSSLELFGRYGIFAV